MLQKRGNKLLTEKKLSAIVKRDCKKFNVPESFGLSLLGLGPKDESPLVPKTRAMEEEMKSWK